MFDEVVACSCGIFPDQCDFIIFTMHAWILEKEKLVDIYTIYCVIRN